MQKDVPAPALHRRQPSLAPSSRFVTDLHDVTGAHASLSPAALRLPFRATRYYLDLIDWNDPADPIRRLIVPSAEEADEGGTLDPCNESVFTRERGLQHKYADTAVLLVTDVCAGLCRYCFRKRLFISQRRETALELSRQLAYIRSTTSITDVLLTGGDPLMLATPVLARILGALRDIPHLRTIRIGSKVPAFDPARITGDARLLGLVRQVVAEGKSIHVMCHFDHPRELTPLASLAVTLLREAGALCLNQCPVTAGINDDAEVLTELFERCTTLGCPQYYVFQCRPTAGNRSFQLPIVRAFEIVSEARSRVSGLSRRARLCLSHSSGKVEIVGVDAERIFARYHRAAEPADEGRMLVLRRDDEARWLDDLALA